MNPDKTNLAHLERKSWHLWLLAILLLFIYAVCIIIVTNPARWESIVKTPARHTIVIILISLMMLTVLFCTYVLINERRISKLRNLFFQQQGMFLQDANFRLSALERIYHLITTRILSFLPAELNKTLDDIARIMSEIFKANYASVMLIDEVDQEIKTQGLAGIESETIRTAVVKLGEAIAGHVVAKNESLLLDDHTDYSKFQGYFKKDLDIQSAISTPIVFADRTIGVINITRLVPADNFTEIDLRWLRRLAQDFAFSVEYTLRLKDLSEREKMLVQQESLIQIGKLAAGLAHDLKNAIFVAQGYLEMLKAEVSVPHEVDWLTKTESALKRIQQTMQNLLILARHASVYKQAMDITQFIHDRCESWKEEFVKKGVSIIMRLAPGLPSISADPEQLQIALLNLIKNAAEAMEHSSKKELTVSTEIMKEALQIKVQDTGCGIPTEIIPKIFTPFFTTKELTHGSGLGLSITSNIIHAHNSQIEVTSKPDKGTIFTITLPLSSPGAV